MKQLCGQYGPTRTEVDAVNREWNLIGGAEPAQLIKKLDISIKKRIISIKKPSISIEKLNISIEKANISIEKPDISIEKASRNYRNKAAKSTKK